MKSVRALARPGWLLGALAVIGFSVACFLVLAPWQLHKNTATQLRNDSISHPDAAVPVSRLQATGAPLDPANAWRLVTVSGHYVTEKQATLRRRSIDGRPAVEIVTPFRTDDGRTVLVDRGYLLRGADQPTDAPQAPTGATTITGRLRAPEQTGQFSAPHVDDGELVAYHLDPDSIGKEMDLTAEPYSVQLSADQPGLLGELPLPEPDSGPYLSYGIQWIAFGALAPVCLAWFTLSRMRAQRARNRV